jgi:hypothetical protein
MRYSLLRQCDEYRLEILDQCDCTWHITKITREYPCMDLLGNLISSLGYWWKHDDTDHFSTRDEYDIFVREKVEAMVQQFGDRYDRQNVINMYLAGFQIYIPDGDQFEQHWWDIKNERIYNYALKRLQNTYDLQRQAVKQIAKQMLRYSTDLPMDLINLVNDYIGPDWSIPQVVKGAGKNKDGWYIVEKK